MNIQTVHKIEVFDRTPATPGFGQPRYVVLVHFSELALQIQNARRQRADFNAIQIAKNLVRGEAVNAPGLQGLGWRPSHPAVDLDTLGEPHGHPDDAGSRVWVTVAPEGSRYRIVIAPA